MNKGVYLDDVFSRYPERYFVRHFRLRKRDIYKLSAYCFEALYTADTKFRKAVPVHHKICLALYKLAKGVDNFSAGEAYGYGPETARRAFI